MRGKGERDDELLEVDSFVVITVKDAEDVVREIARIARREEALMKALEFLPVEAALRVVSHEVLVAVCARAMADRDREGDVRV